VRAAFLDRDGTIIVDRDYTNNPDDVLLLPGAASAIAALSAAGISSIVITNQSGIARGLVSIAQYHAVRRRIDDVLRGEGAELRDTFACPHHPDFTGPCVCRKPATGLYERAAAAHGIDLERSFYIGDRMRDIAAAQAFGGTAVLVRSPATSAADIAYACDHDVPIADSLSDAVARLLAGIQ
jgi:histidinol-phosphate phosphatase family protein